jgi:peptidoglycan/LPS O-acetylase OafA/YrhL
MWRGIACLLVLVFHSTFSGRDHPSIETTTLASFFSAVAARLWLGVPMFFVISGYCISATVDSTRRRPRSVSTYFIRRFRRIYPPFWAVLIGSVLAIGVLDYLIFPGMFSATGIFLRPWWYSTGQWIGNVTLTETWRYHLCGGQKALFLGHTWTLCYEEQFYAVAGLLLLLCPRWFFLGTALITALTAGVLMAPLSLQNAVEGSFLDGGWILFATGVLIYYKINYGTPLVGAVTHVGLILVLVFSAVSIDRLTQVQKTWEQSLACAMAFALVVSVLHRWDDKLASAVWLRPLMFCGTICYSLYLVHLPIVELVRGIFLLAGKQPASISPFVTVPLCSALCIPVAYLFHLAVERRFLNTVPRVDHAVKIAVVERQALQPVTTSL